MTLDYYRIFYYVARYFTDDATIEHVKAGLVYA